MRVILGLVFIALLFPTIVKAAADETANGTTAATLISNPNPGCAPLYYPASEIKAGEEGAVTVTVFIDETGKVTRVDVTQSSGFDDLDKAATECILSRWHYLPATQNGKPVATTKRARIVWHLMGNRALLSKLLPCQGGLAELLSSGNIDNDAILEYRINKAGEVEDPFIAASSGDPIFDAFAAQCVSGLRYAPASTDISWGGEVVGTKDGVWFGNGHGVWNTCDDYMYPRSLPTTNSNFQVVVGFHVTQGGNMQGGHALGNVLDIVVEKSSGDAALDSATLECVKTWEHEDRLFIGPNLDVRMRAKITWRNGHAFVLESLVQ